MSLWYWTLCFHFLKKYITCWVWVRVGYFPGRFLCEYCGIKIRNKLIASNWRMMSIASPHAIATAQNLLLGRPYNKLKEWTLKPQPPYRIPIMIKFNFTRFSSPFEPCFVQYFRFWPSYLSGPALVKLSRLFEPGFKKN